MLCFYKLIGKYSILIYNSVHALWKKLQLILKPMCCNEAPTLLERERRAFGLDMTNASFPKIPPYSNCKLFRPRCGFSGYHNSIPSLAWTTSLNERASKTSKWMGSSLTTRSVAFPIVSPKNPEECHKLSGDKARKKKFSMGLCFLLSATGQRRTIHPRPIQPHC